MNALYDTKTVFSKVKDIDTSRRRIQAYFSMFDNVDSDRDIIQKGAFKKSINERGTDIWFLNHHDWKQPHGKFEQIEEDSVGLLGLSQPLPNTTYSNDTLELYDRGILTQQSIGYVVTQKEMDQKARVRIIKEVKLYEGSNVTKAANESTRFLGLKSFTKKEVEDRTKILTKAIKDGTFSDETFSLLEIALKQLELGAYELGKNSTQQEPVIITTTKDYEPLANAIKSFTNTLNSNN